MAASYPSSAKSFTPIVDGTDYPQAADVNEAYDEITAIEQALVTTGLAHNLLFVDAAHDIGASGATRPRDLFLSRNATAGGTIQSTGATAGIGYATGAGGTVTQATSKSTLVEINTVCGQITTAADALNAGAEAAFVVTNSAVAATDVVVVCIGSGGTAAAYLVGVYVVAAGSFRIVISNVSASNLSEALVINFAVIKGVAA